MEVGDGFWLNRSRSRTGRRAGGERGGCRCTVTQRARSGHAGTVAATASDRLGVDAGVFWTC